MSIEKVPVEDLSLSGLILRIAKDLQSRWVLALSLCLAFSAGGIALAYSLKVKYQSDAVLMAPEKNSSRGLGGDMDALTMMMGVNINKGSIASSFKTLLGTREVALDAIQHFNLDTAYYPLEKRGDSKPKEADLLSSFRSNLRFEESDDGALIVTFRDTDPKRAKDVLERVLQWVDSSYNRAQIGAASENKLFFEKRLREVDSSIQANAVLMRQFQKRTGIVAPEAQFEGSIRMLTDLEVQLKMAELERQREEQVIGPQSQRLPELLAAENLLRAELKKSMNKGGNAFSLSPRTTISEMATYEKLKREAEIQNALYKHVRTQYEQQNLEERKNLRNMIVVQAPWVDDKKVAPPRSAIMFACGLTGVCLTILIISFLQSRRRHLRGESAFWSRWEHTPS